MIRHDPGSCDVDGGPCDVRPTDNPHWGRCSKCGDDSFPMTDFAAGLADTTDAVPVVVNRHWYKDKPMPPHWRYIGRGKPLGNPFTVKEHGAQALELYRRWLWDKIRARDPAILAELGQIRPDTVLVCSCKPRPCHGDVVVRAWAWVREQGLLQQA